MPIMPGSKRIKQKHKAGGKPVEASVDLLRPARHPRPDWMSDPSLLPKKPPPRRQEPS